MPQIPGYYYDEDKKRYFKIEKSSTAPPQATWSADAVKRRKLEHRAHEAAARRERELRRHIGRHGLWDDAVAAGTLRAEIREGQRGLAGRHLRAAAWAGGVDAKGEVRFSPARRGGGNLPCLWVGGGEQGLGTGVVYSTLDEATPLGSHLPVDDDGRVAFRHDAGLDSPSRPCVYVEAMRCPQISSITYHQASRRLLLTSREPSSRCGLQLVSPARPDDAPDIWRFGQGTDYQSIYSSRPWGHGDVSVNNCRPAPPSAPNLLCALSTDTGIVRVASDGTLSPITTPYRSPPRQGPRAGGGRAHHHGGAGKTPRDVFDLDFHVANPDVVFAGGRQPRVWLKDVRTPPAEACPYISHRSSVARLRAVSENHVLVCGLQDAMALYDIRFFPTASSTSSTTISQPSSASSSHRLRPGPLLTFPEHRNSAHLHIGFDVSPESGIVAAAQDDGTVRLFSLDTGRRLVCPALDAAGRTGSPVKALTFQTVPGENSQSLFVGEGLWAKKYSFGTVDLDG